MMKTEASIMAGSGNFKSNMHIFLESAGSEITYSIYFIYYFLTNFVLKLGLLP